MRVFPARAVLILVAAAGIAACPAKKPGVNAGPLVQSGFSKVWIQDEDHRSGIFDPSVEYDSNGIGWMAYSRVSLPKYVATHIARSDDRGRTWRFVRVVNHSFEGPFVQHGRRQAGVWRSETPALVYDAGDTPARRWKLFMHRYPAKPPYRKSAQFHEGWIEMKTARHPAGPWSRPVRLFGREKDRARINISSLHPSLRNVLWYNEMGVIYHRGVIYMSLDASTTESGLGQWRKRRIILITSRDHGRNWKFVGNLTDFFDADRLGYRTLTASSLVKEGRHLYLLASPAGAKGLFKKNKGHDGMIIVRFEDISRARLQRDRRGHLVVRKWIKPTKHSGGVGDYDEQGTVSGILFPQIDLSRKTPGADFFQIYRTGIRINP